MADPTLRFDVPPWRLSGTVVGALLNHRPMRAALGDAVNEPPYKAPPRAPVLAVKPRHMLAAEGDRVGVPADAAGVEVGVSLGIVIGRGACRVAVAEALAHVAGYTVALEIGLPLQSHYRPALRQRARDGFCPIGPAVVPAQEVPQPDALPAHVWVGGTLAQRTDTADRVRGVAQLIADVSEFMTLHAGDVLLLGASHGAPLARSGDTVVGEIEGVGRVHVRLVAEGGAA